MALTLDLSPLARVARSLAGQATFAEWMFQAGVAAAAVAVAWMVARAICGRIATSERWKFGKGDFERVAFPLLAVAFVWIGKGLLGRYHEADPLEIVLAVLIGWAVVRLAHYILGHVVPDGGFQAVVVRFVSWAVWIAVVLHITGLSGEVLSGLDAHGIAFGKSHVTLLDLLKGLAAIFIGVVLALWVSRVTESRVLSAASMEMTTRVVITKVVRIVVLILAVFIALPLAGIDLTTLSILSGAVGVGLGFGLQKIVSNYVSGFIVLLDRSVRIGDIVTVDNRRGEVKAIETRYTVIKGDNGVESIIPNEKLITDSVNHHTYSDPKVSVVIGVTVAYDSDVEKACALLLEAAKRHRHVITEPASAARVKQLTDRGVDLEMTVWIEDPKLADSDIRSELLLEILRDYRNAGIEIPYPHREVRLSATPEMQKNAMQSMS